MGFFSSLFRGRDAPTDRTSGSAYGDSKIVKRIYLSSDKSVHVFDYERSSVCYDR